MKKTILDNSINYTCTVVKTKDVIKHPNADRLLMTNVFGNNVICGLDTKPNELYLYFPIECSLSKEFLTANDLYRRKNPDAGVTEGGMFEHHGRVKCMKLRGEKSEGFLAPLNYLIFLGVDIDLKEGDEFNALNDVLICEKYVVKVKEEKEHNPDKKLVKRTSRIIDNQVRLHVDTLHLKKHIHSLRMNDTIGIHYKKHGTSFWVGNLLVKRKLSFWDKVLIKFGVNIQTTEYDYVYGSRKVIKNKYDDVNHNHYYSYDLWADVKESLKDNIPKGFIVYGEVIGYTKDGAYIQKDFDYGCSVGQNKVFVYRITYTNPDGKVFELSDLQIKQFCNVRGWNYDDTLIFHGTVSELEKTLYNKYKTSPLFNTSRNFEDNFLWMLQEEFTEKDCYMCVNKVPQEGIVLRVDDLFSYNAFKLKSFKFLDYETKQLDKGEKNIEDQNENE
jgi:hypothetical protein